MPVRIMANERLAGLSCRPLASGKCSGGTMRTGRAIIFSAILALGLAGPVMAISTATVATAQAPAAHVQAISVAPAYFYHG